MTANVEDLEAAAREELERACTLAWRDLAQHTPWGDVFEGFSPSGQDVCFERSYLWEDESGGDIQVEVAVYTPRDYEAGVRITRVIRKPPG